MRPIEIYIVAKIYCRCLSTLLTKYVRLNVYDVTRSSSRSEKRDLVRWCSDLTSLTWFFWKMPSFCLMVGCSNDKKNSPELSFSRVPKIITNQGSEMEELSNERRRLWLAAVALVAMIWPSIFFPLFLIFFFLYLLSLFHLLISFNCYINYYINICVVKSSLHIAALV